MEFVQAVVCSTTIVGLAMAAYVWASLKIVPHGQSWVIESLGAYSRCIGAGPHLVLYGIENVRDKVDLREQVLPLFQGEGYPPADVHIQLEDVKQAKPLQAMAFVRVLDPHKSVYGVDNWKLRLTNLLEPALRSLFNRITYDTAMATTDFFPLFTNPERKDLLTKASSEWGVDILRVSVARFDLPIGAPILAIQEAAAKAIQICGTLLEMQQRLAANGYPQDEAKALAEDIFKYAEAAKTGTLLDVRTQGENSPLIAAIAAVTRSTGLGRP